jgi:anti-sigma regulatory factor (Ser/Thr protein kinase)
VPFDEAAATARRLITELLTRHRVPRELVSDAALVVHELVINGLMHGEPDPHGRIGVSARLTTGRLTIDVTDHGRDGTIAAQPLTDDRAHGRGLAMVAALSDGWSVDRSAGTRVSAWFSW